MPQLNRVDHKVKHKSTIPANSGEEIELFVREYTKATGSAGTPKPVLMLHGRSVPALPGFDLVLPAKGSSPNPDTSYSWAQFLAGKGYDVYTMDLQGSGLSPRPKMEDPCNANPAQRACWKPTPARRPAPRQRPTRTNWATPRANGTSWPPSSSSSGRGAATRRSPSSAGPRPRSSWARTRCSIPETWRACSFSHPSFPRPAAGRRTPRHPSPRLPARDCRRSPSPSRPRSSASR